MDSRILLFDVTPIRQFALSISEPYKGLHGSGLLVLGGECWYSASASAPARACSNKRDFDDDMWVQRERAAQVLRPFFKKYGRLQLAQILLDEDPILAGKIAAEEYERLLNTASWHVRHRALPQDKGAKLFVEELTQKNFIRQEDNVELKRVWEIRNKAVHPASGDRPTREEVEVMIDVIQRICVPWEKHGLRARAAHRGT